MIAVDSDSIDDSPEHLRDTFPDIKSIVRRFTLQSSLMKKLFLVTLFVMTFRNFQFFPGMAPVQEFWYASCFIFLLTVYPWLKARTQWRFSLFEFYVLAMMFVIPLQSGFSAWREFGQPLFYGILSQRSVTLFAGVLLFIHGLRYHRITLRDVEKSLLFLAWSTLVLYLIMKALLDPSMFASYGRGFVEGGGGEHPLFKLPSWFIVFGNFYYAFLGFRKKQGKYYWIAGLMFIFLVGDVGGRSMAVAMPTAFIFFVSRWGGRARLIKLLPKILVVTTLFVGIAYIARPEAVSSRVQKMSEALIVAFIGNEVEDVSATARVYETQLAMPYVQKHPITGNGNISNQWQDGYEGVLGGYFYPSDIGIVGVLYMYGLVGLLLFSGQYLFAVRAARELPSQMYSPLLDATKGILLCMAISSLATGVVVHYAEISFLFIAVLECIAREMRASRHPIKIV